MRSRQERPPCQDPMPGHALLESLFARRGLGTEFVAYRALRAFWAAAPYLRARARAVHFVPGKQGSGVLFLRVDSAATAEQIQQTKLLILQRIRQQEGGCAVKDLRWTIGDLQAAPDFRDDEPPGPPPRIARARSAQPPQAEAINAIAKIDDKELRRRLHSLYHIACKTGKTVL